MSLLGTMLGQRPMTADVQAALAELKAMNKLGLARQRAASGSEAPPANFDATVERDAVVNDQLGAEG